MISQYIDEIHRSANHVLLLLVPHDMRQCRCIGFTKQKNEWGQTFGLRVQVL